MPTSARSTTTPKSKRRWFQFSLRSLMVLMTLFAVWLGFWVHRAQTQKEALEVILGPNDVHRGSEYHANVLYGFELDKRGNRIPNPEPLAPRWLREKVGEDLFRTVVWVYLNGDKVTTEQLGAVKRLPSVHTVSVVDTHIGDPGLEHLSEMPQLKDLVFHDTSITDAGMAHVGRLSALKELSIWGGKVTDAGVAHLSELEDLERLALVGYDVTDEGLRHLRQMKKLTYLNLGGTKISDRGLRHLKTLTNLRELEIGDTDVTDAGLKELRQALPNCQIRK